MALGQRQSLQVWIAVASGRAVAPHYRCSVGSEMSVGWEYNVIVHNNAFQLWILPRIIALLETFYGHHLFLAERHGFSRSLCHCKLDGASSNFHLLVQTLHTHLSPHSLPAAVLAFLEFPECTCWLLLAQATSVWKFSPFS